MSLKTKLIGKQNLFSAVFIFLFAASLYLPTTNIPFINDEIYFIQRNKVQSLTGLYTLFNKKDYDGYYYRPLPDFISGLITYFFKYDSRYYRVFNLLLHSAAAVLVYFLISMLLKIPDKNYIALFAALFFAAFPIHDYAVIWQTDLFDRIMMLFYIAGLIAYTRNNFKPALSSIAFFILSLLSKEMAFSFPLIIALIYFFFCEPKFNIKRSLASAAPYAAVAVLFIIARIILFNNDLFTAKDAHSTAGVMDVIKNYFLFSGITVFPFFIREVQNFISTDKLPSLLSAGIAMIVFIAYLIRYRKKDYILYFFILFFIFALAPASRLLMRWYLYLPSIGFTAALSYFIFTIPSKGLKVKLTAAILILVVYSAALAQRESLWIKYSNKSVKALKSFIEKNRNEISNNREAVFLTIPAKVDDIPVFQLGFDYLFNYYMGSNDSIHVDVLSKSYVNHLEDTVNAELADGKIIMSQTDRNYFILFNNEKNIKFEPLKIRNGNLSSLSINLSEVKNKVLYTFSNGIFYKLEGL